MKMSITSGATLATAAAALFLAGAVAAPTAQAEEAQGHCMGANACKGQSACKTANNACNGQNACKGQGFTSTTQADCEAIEGATFEPVEG